MFVGTAECSLGCSGLLWLGFSTRLNSGIYWFWVVFDLTSFSLSLIIVEFMTYCPFQGVCSLSHALFYLLKIYLV